MEYVYVGDHAQPLSTGRSLAAGDRVKDAELGPEDQYLVDDEKLLDLARFSAEAAPEPIEGYDALSAPDVVAVLKDADPGTATSVRIYEGAHAARKTVLEAAVAAEGGSA